MSVTVIENASPSENEPASQVDLAVMVGEMKGLLTSLSQTCSAITETLQEIKATQAEILSLAETIEETTEETAEAIEEQTAETESENEEEEKAAEAEVEVIIPAAPIMTEAPPEKPDHPLVSMGRKLLLGQSE